VDPAADDAFELHIVVVPTPVLVNPVTDELLFIVIVAVEISDGANEKNVIVPVVFTEIFVNVLLSKV